MREARLVAGLRRFSGLPGAGEHSVDVVHAGHLDSVLKALKRVDSVYDVYRVLPGSGKS